MEVEDLEEPAINVHDVDDGDEVETSEECQNLDEHMRKEINEILQSLQGDEEIKAKVQEKGTRKIIIQKNCKERSSLAEVDVLLIIKYLKYFCIQVHEKQKEIAEELLQKIKSSPVDLSRFKFFDYFILVPKFMNLGKFLTSRKKYLIL